MVALALLVGAGIAGPMVVDVRAQQGPAPAIVPAAQDPVLARVNGAEIRQSDVFAAIQQLPPQVQQMPPEILLPALLDQLIGAKLVAAAGYAQNLQETEAVKARVRRAEERAVQEVYLNQALNDAVTDEKLRARYDSFVQENPPQDEVRARHILVPSQAEATQVLADLNAGADFAELARTRSKDPGSAEQGGDLGFFSASDMVQPFADVAFSLSPGAVGQSPVQTQFGWHVVKVEERRAGSVPTFEQAQPELRSQLQEEEIGKLLDTLRRDARIERFNPDGTAAPAGGSAR